MNSVMNWLENSFAPRANKFANNVWVVSLKDAIMQALPMIFLGSLFAMLAILGEWWPWFNNFWALWGWTMGLVSLFIAFLLPFNLMEKKRLRKNRFNAGMAGLTLFLLIIAPRLIQDEAVGFGHEAFGAGGMFVAIVAGMFVGLIMSLFGKFSFFKETSVIPDFVRAWFDAMLPIAVVVIIGWLLTSVAGLDIYGVVQSIFAPLQYGMQTLPGLILMVFVMVFTYSMGISPWVLTPAIMPALHAAIVQNMQGGAQNLTTYPTLFTAYLFIGGIGTTLPLVLLMLRSRSRKIKALGKACLPPSIVNINEPVVFGAIAWNPTLMVPMWLQGIILPVVIYLFTRVIPLAPIPMRQFDLWYTPFPISTWLSVHSIGGIALFLIIFALSTAIWYPFFKSYEKQSLLAEAEDDNKHTQRTERVIIAEPVVAEVEPVIAVLETADTSDVLAVSELGAQMSQRIEVEGV